MRTMCLMGVALALGWGGIASPAWAQEEAPMKEALKVGDPALDFAIPKTAGAEEPAAKKLSDYQGKKNVLLAFYPKAFTGGCTKQMCGYRDDFARFQSAETEILAISTDEQPDSDRFKQEYSLPFPVLGDPEQAIIKAYGVPLREGEGAHYATRSVFLIDREGVIRYINRQYSVTDGVAPLYEALGQVSSGGAEAGAPAAQSQTP